MKKAFIIEVDYQELEDISFLDEGIDLVVEQLLDGYAESKYINKEFSVSVREISRD